MRRANAAVCVSHLRLQLQKRHVKVDFLCFKEKLDVSPLGFPSDLLHIIAPVEQALTADGPVFPQDFVAEIAVGENDFIHERIFMQHQGVHIML